MPGKLQIGHVELTPTVWLVADEAGEHVCPGAHDARLDAGHETELIVEAGKLSAGGLGHWVAHEKPTTRSHESDLDIQPSLLEGGMRTIEACRPKW